MNLISFFRPARHALLIALLALPFSVCPAQESAPPAKMPRETSDDLITITFPGGPLSELVSSLNANKNTKLSIIQSQGLDPVLPGFSVNNVRTFAVISALGQLLEPQGYMLNPVGPNLAVLAKIDHRKSNAFASFQLASKLGDGKVEDIVAAIQQGCEFASEGKPSTLRFKYHPGTKLLFVAGSPEEVEVAHRVYGSLPGYPPNTVSAPPAPPLPPFPPVSSEKK